MKACGLITLFTTLMLGVGVYSLRANTIVWGGSNSGNWSVSANWNPHHVPGSADIAIITNTGNYTVTLDATIAVAGLTLGATNVGSTQILSFNGQTLTLGGQATVNSGGQFNLSSGTFIGKTNNSGGAVFIGTLACSGGALAGKLTMTSNSVLNFAGSSASNSLKGLILLTNYGTVNWSNTDLYGATSLQVFNFGLWDAQTNNNFYGNGTVFNNTGTFRKSAGGGISMLDSNITFNSTGTVDLQGGTLAVRTGTCSGIFNTASGTILNFGYNPNLITFTLTGNTTFTGSGIVEGVLISGSNALIGGTVTFSAATLCNTMTISNTGVVNFVGTLGTNTFGTAIFNSYFNSYGTVNWCNTDLRVGAVSATAQINNYGLWDAQTNASLYAVFNNYGTFRKSGGTESIGGYTGFNIFNNYGTLDVQVGAVLSSGGTGSGVFNNATNTVIYLQPSINASFLQPYILTGNPTFTGAGVVEGYYSGNNAVIHGALNFLLGTLSGTLTVASGGAMNFLTSPDPTINLNWIYFNNLVLTNDGTVNWNGDLYGQSSPQIYNYGLWDDQTNSTFSGAYSGGGTTTFNNYGTFRKSGGTVDNPPYSTTFDNNTTFNNYGTLDDQVGFVVISGGTGNGVFNINSTFNVGIYLQSAYTLTGSSTFLGGGGVAGNFTGNNAVIQGTLTLNFGTLAGTMTVASNAVLNLGLVPQQPVALQGIILTNYGTVIWNGDDLRGQSSPQIYNYGLWDDQTNSTFSGAYSGGGTTTFNNYGTFRKSGGSLNDSGQIYTLFDNNTTFTNYGTVDNQTGLLEFDNANCTDSGTINDTNYSTTEWFGGCVLTGNPMFTGNGWVNGNFTGNNALVHGAWATDYSTLSGTLTIVSNAVLNLTRPSFSGMVVLQGTILTNYGVVIWDFDLRGQSSPQIFNYGLWDDQTNNTFYGAYSGSGTTTFNNYGTFRKSGGGNLGETFLDNNTTFNNPGTVDVQTGLLDLGGSYSLTGGTLNFGINSSNDCGSIGLGINAALAGKLSVNLNNNYSPVANTSFNLLFYGSETGTFNALNVPHLSGGLVWQTNYSSMIFTGSMAFTLSVTNPPTPRLSSMTLLNGGTISFGWNGVAGQTYQVQCTTNLSLANWINLGNSMPGTNGTMTVSDVIGLDSQRFYRLVLQ